MAQIAEGDIKPGSTRTVGKSRIDPGRVRGEGGPWDPRLVIPVEVQMNPRPSGEQIALLSVTGRLFIGDSSANPALQVGLPAVVDLLRGMHARSVPHGPNSHYVDLRIAPTLYSATRLEVAAMQQASRI
jgi:hypothetical protein